MIVHLPTTKPIKRMRDNKPLKYQNLLEELKSTYELLDPSLELIRQAEASSLVDLFENQSNHYSYVSNKIIGEVLANALLAD